MTAIGVIIAAHNCEETIAETLTSLIDQDHEDWRAVIVDDSSTDGTIEAIQPFLVDPRIRLLKNERNLGSGASRNRGLKALDTDLVAVLDGDDICLPSRLSHQAAAFEADPRLVVLGAQVAEFGAWGGPDSSRRWPTTHEEITGALSDRMPIAHCVVMYKRKQVLDVGGYDERLRRAQDLALMLRLKGHRFSALDSVELMYRTSRPITLAYAMRSGRGGYLARYWDRNGDSAPAPSQMRLRLVDLRSLVTWARRRLRELTAEHRISTRGQWTGRG